MSYFVGLGGREGAVQRCPNCRGTGMQVRVQQLGPGMMQQIQSVCHECQGQGERIDPKHRCKTCNGRKVGYADYRNAYYILPRPSNCLTGLCAAVCKAVMPNHVI